MTNCDKIANVALLSSFLDRILDLIISIMFEFDVFDVTIATDGLSICAKIPQVDHLCFDVVGIARWLWGILNEFHLVLQNGRCLAVDFYFFDEFKVNVTVMLEVNMFSWLSPEFAVLYLWLLRSPWVESSQSHLRLGVSLYFTSVILIDFFNDWSVFVYPNNLFAFVCTNFLWSWFDFFSLGFNFRWGMDFLFWGSFNILISLPSDWLSVEAKQVINHVHIWTWLCCWCCWSWLRFILWSFLDDSWLWSNLNIIFRKCHRLFNIACLTFLGNYIDFAFFFNYFWIATLIIVKWYPALLLFGAFFRNFLFLWYLRVFLDLL